MRTQKIPELDGIRAIAVLAVIFFHIEHRIFRGGFLGVDLFFVLSGFLITSLLIAEYNATGTIDFRAFFARRALRIIPPIVIGLLLAALLWPSESRTMMLSIVPSVLFFYANFMDYREMGLLGHTWSLSIEEQFYAFWPFLFLFLIHRKHAVSIIVLFIVGSAALRLALYFLGADVGFLYRFSPVRMDSLAAGCLIALWRPNLGLGPWSLAFLFCTVFAAFMLPTYPHPVVITIGHSILAVLFSLFILNLFTVDSAHPVRRLLSNTAMRYIGQRSYGLYLYHVPIIATLEQFKDRYSVANVLVLSIAEIALSFLIAELSFRTIETWALSYKSRYRVASDKLKPGQFMQPQ